MPRFALALALAIAVAVAGCQRTAPLSPRAAPEPVGVPKDSPITSGATLLRLVPKDALAVVMSASPQELLPRFGYTALVEKYRSHYDMAAAAVTKTAGRDLLDLTKWPEAGLDPSRPVGLAWLSVEKELGAAYVAVTDAKAAIATLQTIATSAEDPLVARKVGAATVLIPGRGRDVAFVVREGHLVMVFGSPNAAKAAERIATLAEKQSLGADARFKSSVARLGAGRDLAGWMDLRALLDGAREDELKRAASSEDAWADKELETAKKDKAPKEVIARLERAVAEERERRKRRMEEKKRGWALAQKLYGPISGMSFGLSADSGAIAGQVVVAAPDGALIVKSLRNGKGIPVTVKALSAAPFYLFHGSGDPEVIWDFIQEAAAAGGDSGDLEGMKHLLSKAAIDFDRDILGNVNGEVGFAMTIELPENAPAARNPKFGGSVVVGVGDVDAAQGLLEKIAALHGVEERAKRDESVNGWSVEVPGLGMAWVAAAAGAIAGSTSLEFIQRAGGAPGASFVDTLTNPALKALLETPDTAMTWTMQTGLLTQAFMSWGGLRDEAMSKPANGSTSAEAQAKHAELEKVRQELQTVEENQRRDSWGHLRALGDRFGTTASIAKVVPGTGLVITGGQYLGAPSVETAAIGIIDALVALNQINTAARSRRAELWETQDRLRRELEVLEQAAPE